MSPLIKWYQNDEDNRLMATIITSLDRSPNFVLIVVGTFLISLIAACSTPRSPTTLLVYENNEFLNYISISDTGFADGHQRFYPMVMNYSMDVHAHSSSKGPCAMVRPRAGYHPEYGDGQGENLSPWSADPMKAMNTIRTHFSVIKQMGFNTLRITGFTATDYYNEGEGFHTWSRIDLSNTPAGNQNIQECIVPLMRAVIKAAEEEQLRVILLLSAVESLHEHQVNLFDQVALGLQDEKALMAIDIFNEPLYSDHGEYTKQETKEFVRDYNEAIRSASPNQLTTIGLSHYKIVQEWDPEMLDVDFLSFHIYPYWSKNLSKLERFDAKFQWIEKNITKPWIIGETGLNTAKGCEPLNFSWGNLSDQLEFMNYSLERAREAGAWGYSWWSYQDMAFPPGKIEGTCNVTDYGLVDRSDTFFFDALGDTVVGLLKHAMEDLPFHEFLSDDPYGLHGDYQLPEPGDVYYNIDYLPTKEHVEGSVATANGEPIEGAIVTLFNTGNGVKYATFTRPNGSFKLYTGWTDVLEFPEYELKVTAVRMTTVLVPLSTLRYAGSQMLKVVTLSPVEDH